VKNGKLPVTQQGISLSRKGVAVAAFGPNPDGNGTVFRVWEQGNVSGDLTVELPSNSKYETALPVNLRGEKTGEPIKISGGKFIFPLKAYAPASFILN